MLSPPDHSGDSFSADDEPGSAFSFAEHDAASSANDVEANPHSHMPHCVPVPRHLYSDSPPRWSRARDPYPWQESDPDIIGGGRMMLGPDARRPRRYVVNEHDFDDDCDDCDEDDEEDDEDDADSSSSSCSGCAGAGGGGGGGDGHCHHDGDRHHHADVLWRLSMMDDAQSHVHLRRDHESVRPLSRRRRHRVGFEPDSFDPLWSGGTSLRLSTSTLQAYGYDGDHAHEDHHNYHHHHHRYNLHDHDGYGDVVDDEEDEEDVGHALHHSYMSNLSRQLAYMGSPHTLLTLPPGHHGGHARAMDGPTKLSYIPRPMMVGEGAASSRGATWRMERSRVVATMRRFEREARSYRACVKACGHSLDDDDEERDAAVRSLLRSESDTLVREGVLSNVGPAPHRAAYAGESEAEDVAAPSQRRLALDRVPGAAPVKRARRAVSHPVASPSPGITSVAGADPDATPGHEALASPSLAATVAPTSSAQPAVVPMQRTSSLSDVGLDASSAIRERLPARAAKAVAGAPSPHPFHVEGSHVAPALVDLVCRRTGFSRAGALRVLTLKRELSRLRRGGLPLATCVSVLLRRLNAARRKARITASGGRDGLVHSGGGSEPTPSTATAVFPNTPDADTAPGTEWAHLEPTDVGLSATREVRRSPTLVDPVSLDPASMPFGPDSVSLVATLPPGASPRTAMDRTRRTPTSPSRAWWRRRTRAQRDAATAGEPDAPLDAGDATSCASSTQHGCESVTVDVTGLDQGATPCQGDEHGGNDDDDDPSLLPDQHGPMKRMRPWPSEGDKVLLGDTCMDVRSVDSAQQVCSLVGADGNLVVVPIAMLGKPP